MTCGSMVAMLVVLRKVILKAHHDFSLRCMRIMLSMTATLNALPAVQYPDIWQSGQERHKTICLPWRAIGELLTYTFGTRRR